MNLTKAERALCGYLDMMRDGYSTGVQLKRMIRAVRSEALEQAAVYITAQSIMAVRKPFSFYAAQILALRNNPVQYKAKSHV